jgi:hypothetical protein
MVYDVQEYLTSLFQPAHDHLHHTLVRPEDLPVDWREHYEERAAIMEADGGLDAESANAAALADTLEVMRQRGAGPK